MGFVVWVLKYLLLVLVLEFRCVVWLVLTVLVIQTSIIYSKIFDGRLIEMQYVVKMLEDNLKKFELTQAQNLSSWRH